MILEPYCQRIGQLLVAQNKNTLKHEHKREMIEQKPLPKSQLTKTTLVAHASKLVIKIQGSNPNWRLQCYFAINKILALYQKSDQIRRFVRAKFCYFTLFFYLRFCLTHLSKYPINRLTEMLSDSSAMRLN